MLGMSGGQAVRTAADEPDTNSYCHLAESNGIGSQDMDHGRVMVSLCFSMIFNTLFTRLDLAAWLLSVRKWRLIQQSSSPNSRDSVGADDGLHGAQTEEQGIP